MRGSTVKVGRNLRQDDDCSGDFSDLHPSMTDVEILHSTPPEPATTANPGKVSGTQKAGLNFWIQLCILWVPSCEHASPASRKTRRETRRVAAGLLPSLNPDDSVSLSRARVRFLEKRFPERLNLRLTTAFEPAGCDGNSSRIFQVFDSATSRSRSGLSDRLCHGVMPSERCSPNRVMAARAHPP
jgi:hypothetical protein